jgi:nicotinamidase-related amidase
VRELGPEPEDLVSVRLHGVAPFVGTDLDARLRNLGVRTVVLVGGSVNLGIVGAAVEAVDLGYRVVVPRDGVIGHPTDYTELVLEHTLALLARLTTVDELLAEWR